MQVSSWVWALTVLLLAALLAFDFVFHVRKAHVPSLREAGWWSAAYIGIAIAFGLGILVLSGTEPGAEYFAGYVTEKALSVDNLFVFLIIITSFKVPRADQQKVLLFGITFSLLARTGFIFLGAALIHTFAWVFYVFGFVLVATAGNLLKPAHEDGRLPDNLVIRLARSMFHTSDTYDGDKLFTVEDGRRVMTPMLLVMAAIAGTDVLFVLDSIPAIFGLTRSTFIVFTATAFSLIGLRQLYFVIDGLLDRLIYLRYGLSAILGFIGVKLVLHALHENNVPFINDGRPIKVVEITTGASLSVIVGILLVTIVASLRSATGRAHNAVAAARRHAIEYLEVPNDPAYREEVFSRLVREIEIVRALPAKYRATIRAEHEFMELLSRAQAVHDRGAVSEHGHPRVTPTGLHEPS